MTYDSKKQTTPNHKALSYDKEGSNEIFNKEAIIKSNHEQKRAS